MSAVVSSCNRRIFKDENGLIIPQKLSNPCLDSVSVKDLHREIRWNNKKGINVLDNKSELDKVLTKQRRATEQKVREVEREEECDPFKKMLAERAKRLDELEAKPGDERESEESFNHQRMISSQNIHCSQYETSNKTAGDTKSRGLKKNVTSLKDKNPTLSSSLAKEEKNLKNSKVKQMKEHKTAPESEFAKVFAQMRGGGDRSRVD